MAWGGEGTRFGPVFFFARKKGWFRRNKPSILRASACSIEDGDVRKKGRLFADGGSAASPVRGPRPAPRPDNPAAGLWVAGGREMRRWLSWPSSARRDLRGKFGGPGGLLGGGRLRGGRFIPPIGASVKRRKAWLEEGDCPRFRPGGGRRGRRKGAAGTGFALHEATWPPKKASHEALADGQPQAVPPNLRVHGSRAGFFFVKGFEGDCLPGSGGHADCRCPRPSKRHLAGGPAG